MKRYLAWTHLDYYPGGAREDLIGDFDELSEALEAAVEDMKCGAGGFYCILDTETGEWL